VSGPDSARRSGVHTAEGAHGGIGDDAVLRPGQRIEYAGRGLAAERADRFDGGDPHVLQRIALRERFEQRDRRRIALPAETGGAEVADPRICILNGAAQRCLRVG
jgi:hypothetical protein